MPLYEYQCDQCGRRFELIQKMSDPPAETCPTCGGAVHKLQSAPAFQFKGTGWYITDYAKKDQGSGKSEGGSKSESKDSSSETKSDSKASGDKGSETKSTTSDSSSAPSKN